MEGEAAPHASLPNLVAHHREPGGLFRLSENTCFSNTAFNPENCTEIPGYL